MLYEVIDILRPCASKIFIDATFGRGGHSIALLAHEAQVIAIDRDKQAIETAMAVDNCALHMIWGRFGDMNQCIRSQMMNADNRMQNNNRMQPLVDGVLFDLGLSTPQIMQESRGFSFQRDGPLDMRMGLCDMTAADIVNSYSAPELADIFWMYGEESRSRYIAAKIVERRQRMPFESTLDLAEFIAQHLRRQGKIHPATKIFQALRIVVNDEMGELKRGLKAATNLLKPGGKLVVISFHSLEDRIVKHFFRQNNFTTPQPQPCYASNDEVQRNVKARSAKLRWGFCRYVV